MSHAEVTRHRGPAVLWGLGVLATLALVNVALLLLHSRGQSLLALLWVREDGLFESAGATACLVAAALFLAAATGKSSSDLKPSTSQRAIQVCAAVALLLMFVEEISWGQRALGFATPSWMLAENRQFEFNLHNLFFFNPATDYNWLKLVWSLFAVAYLGVLPLVVAWSQRVAAICHRVGLPVASLPVGIAMLGSFLNYWHGTEQSRHSGDALAGHEAGETFELVIELSYLALAVETIWRAAHSGRFTSRAVWAALALGLLVPGLTLVVGGYLRNPKPDAQTFATAHLRQARFLLARDNPQDALNELERSLDVWPNNPEAEFLVGVTYFRQQSPEQAIRHLRRAWELDPQFLDAAYNLGLVLLDQRQFDQAADALGTVVEQRPSDFEARYHFARALIGVGRPREAMSQLEAAVELKNDYSAAMELLAELRSNVSE